MKEILATQGRLTVRIEQDSDAQSPADNQDTGAFLVGWHTREFYVAPPGEKGSFDSQGVVDTYKATHHLFPLEAYIHSGVRLALMNEGNFCDRQWDVSSNVGAIFLAKAEWRTKSKKAWKYARAVVKEWNQYLSGDIWGYLVEDQNGEVVDSCWGFYGSEYAEEEAKAALLACAKRADDVVTRLIAEEVKA